MFEAKSNEMSHITTISLSSEHAYACTRTHSHAHTHTHTLSLSLTLTQTKAYTIHQSTNRYFHQSGIILPKCLPCLPVPALALPHCGYTGLCQRPPFNSHVNLGQSHILWILKLSPRLLKWFRQKYVRGTSQFSTKASSTKLLSSLTKSIWPPLPKSWSATLIEKFSAVDVRGSSHLLLASPGNAGL